MTNRKRNSSQRMDFIPNKLNKYSIRKFTVGTASILVGATLFLGHHEAEAAENNNPYLKTIAMNKKVLKLIQQ